MGSSSRVCLNAKIRDAVLIKLGELASIIETYLLGTHARKKIMGLLFVEKASEVIKLLVVIRFLGFQLWQRSCH